MIANASVSVSASYWHFSPTLVTSRTMVASHVLTSSLDSQFCLTGKNGLLQDEHEADLGPGFDSNSYPGRRDTIISNDEATGDFIDPGEGIATDEENTSNAAEDEQVSCLPHEEIRGIVIPW